MHKNYFVLLAVGLLLVACQNYTYTITGTVPDDSLNGKTVYLTDFNSASTRLDSAVIDQNQFVFTGEVSAEQTIPQLYLVNCERSSAYCFVEPGQITVTLPVDRRAPQQVAQGTPMNAALAQFFATRDTLFNEIRAYKGTDDEVNAFYDNDWMPRYKSAMEGVLDANLNNDIGTLVISGLNGYVEDSQMKAYIEKVGEEVTKSAQVQSLSKTLKALETTAEGMMFTDFTIPDSNGKSESFSEFIGKGKYVLVDFWASWCGPCRAEVPNLKDVYKKFNGKDFTILGVAVWDEPAETIKAEKELELPWHSIINAQKVPTDIYGINGIPHIILFGPDGTIVARGLRGEAIGKKVAEVLGK